MAKTEKKAPVAEVKEEAVKAAPKAEKPARKPAARKAAPKAEKAPKAPKTPKTPKAPKTPKTPRAPRAPKTEAVYVQFAGAEWSVADVREKAVADFVAKGGKKSAVKKLALYVKPEDHRAFYVVNDETDGSVEL